MVVCGVVPGGAGGWWCETDPELLDLRHDIAAHHRPALLCLSRIWLRRRRHDARHEPGRRRLRAWRVYFCGSAQRYPMRQTILTVPNLPYRINFLPDGSVISADGEYPGTWDTEESDAI